MSRRCLVAGLMSLSLLSSAAVADDSPSAAVLAREIRPLIDDSMQPLAQIFGAGVVDLVELENVRSTEEVEQADGSRIVTVAFDVVFTRSLADMPVEQQPLYALLLGDFRQGQRSPERGMLHLRQEQGGWVVFEP